MGLMDHKARRRDAARWRDAGLTYKQIGDRIGVSGSQACVMVNKAHRERDYWNIKLKEENESFSAHLKYIWPMKNAGKL
jgi:DNA-binding transcriptional regulator LsrR (DeoR family)